MGELIRGARRADPVGDGRAPRLRRDRRAGRRRARGDLDQPDGRRVRRVAARAARAGVHPAQRGDARGRWCAIEKITAEQEGLSKKDVKGVLESLVSVGHKEMKKSGTFLLPGFAKFVVIKKPATKERAGINPFTKEPTVFKAKPARKIVRARPVKAAKDAV